MASTPAALINQAAVLHGLVDFVSSHCAERRDGHAYADSNEQLFTFIEQTAKGTRSYLQRQVERAASQSDWELNISSGLKTLRKFWIALHHYVKPAVDAHSLAVPAPLLELATSQLRMVEGMSNSSFVILLTPELNYFEHPRTTLASLSSALDNLLPGCQFPPDLGLVSIPYSMGLGLFNNLLLYHELGHFTKEMMASRDDPRLGDLQRGVEAGLKAGLGELNDVLMTKYSEIINGWLEEIFCDLFAVRLIGPAFSFALCDFLDLLPLDDSDGFFFDSSHPAIALRLGYHSRQLDRDGWWPHLDGSGLDKIPALRRLKAASATTEEKYRCRGQLEPKLEKTLIKCVIECAELLPPLVEEVTRNVRPCAGLFGDMYRQTAVLLRNGIVPSAGLSPASGLAEAVINGSYSFVLASAEELEAKLKLEPSQSVATRSLCRRRVEAWAMKAVGDLRVVRGAA